tara:strand:- start:131 stop:301 length:171 start_codon:yes stop_codon:yes gene_type:complete
MGHQLGKNKGFFEMYCIISVGFPSPTYQDSSLLADANPKCQTNRKKNCNGYCEEIV